MPAIPSYSDRERWLMMTFRREDLTTAMKLTGAAIVWHLNFVDGLMCPSMKTIATKTVQKERTVRKHVAKFNHLGLLGVEPFGRGYRYTLGFGTGMSVPVKPKARARRNCTDTGTVIPVSNPEQRNGRAGERPAIPERQRCDSGTAIPMNSGMAIPPNLESKPMSNHTADFGELRREIGEDRWRQHLWDGATIELPKTIVFSTRQRLEFALKHFSADFDRLGYTAVSRSAP